MTYKPVGKLIRDYLTSQEFKIQGDKLVDSKNNVIFKKVTIPTTKRVNIRIDNKF
jgi:hypothetical protein